MDRCQLEGVYITDEINIDVSGDNVVGAKGTSIQFPILVKIGNILDNGMYLGGVGGVYFTLPVGNGELKTHTILGDYTYIGDWKASTMGFMVGGACSPVAYPQPCIRFNPPTAVLS